MIIIVVESPIIKNVFLETKEIQQYIEFRTLKFGHQRFHLFLV